MHVQVVNFKLVGVDEAGYVSLCDELAPAFAAVPGLLTKLWLADASTGVYGGVYVWESRGAMEAFVAGELFAAVAAHPNLTDITSRDWGTLAGPTAVTSRIRTTVA